MKYEYHPQRRTEQERRDLNEQILRLLQSGACEQAGVTDEDIFNRYTGDGGLHGLQRSDYDNYNAFSAAKKDLENGQFFTPPPLCEMIVSALRLSDTDLVADLTCGMGNFFNFLPNEDNAYGCEIDPNACAVAQKLYPQARIVQGDIRSYEPQTHFDCILGNPPFHLRWIMPDATVMTSHQYYCLKAAKLLKPLGILAIIVPASFLADSFSDKSAIRMMESQFSFLGQLMLPDDSFAISGVDDFPTKLQFWQKKSTAANWTPNGTRPILRISIFLRDIQIWQPPQFTSSLLWWQRQIKRGTGTKSFWKCPCFDPQKAIFSIVCENTCIRSAAIRPHRENTIPAFPTFIAFILSSSRRICPTRSGSACSLPKQRCWHI